MKGFSGFKSEGPVKPKSIVSAKQKDIKKPSVHPDSDRHISAVPTFSDHIEEAKERKKDPDYKRAKKVNKYPKSYTKKDIRFLKKQREDIVRREDLDEKGKKIFDRKKAKKW